MKIKNIVYCTLAVAVFVSCDVIPENQRIEDVPLGQSDRVVLLNEFTGWNCVNCPDAAKVAKNLMELIPENIIVVGMHPDGHGFTTPSGSAPDFRSKEAMDYLSAYGGSISTGLPAGVINGRKFDGSYIQVHAKWNAQVLAQRAVAPDCFVELSHSMDGAKHKVSAVMTPQTSMDYSVSLQMWLVESGIIGAQNSHGGYITDYTHNHVFRHCINSLWGDDLGKLAGPADKDYTFTVDADYNEDNCSVVAVLINTDTHEVVQAAEIAIGKGVH